LLGGPLNITGLPNPFTFSSYAAVDVSLVERPLIARDPTAWKDGKGILLNLHGVDGGIRMVGIGFRGGEVGVGFTWRPTRPQVVRGVTVADCLFDSVKGADFQPTSATWWGHSIALARAMTPVDQYDFVVEGVSVRNNVFTSSDTVYANSLPTVRFPQTQWTRAFVRGLDIDGNAIVNCSMNNVFLDTTTAVTVRRNVFLRNAPHRLFTAGTTDIIVGTLNASDSIVDNELGYRGEFQPGGPDGCAIDLETAPDGVLIARNYIHRSYGAGLMVFGHQNQAPRNIRVVNNTFLWAGCNQTRGDHGGISFMGNGTRAATGYAATHLTTSRPLPPSHHPLTYPRPTACHRFAMPRSVVGNVLRSCPGTPAFNVNMDGAADGFTFASNIVHGVDGGYVTVIGTPDVAVVVAGDPAAGYGPTLEAKATTPGSQLFYTTDGSVPVEEDSLVWPRAGRLRLPARATAVFVKAFADFELERAVAAAVASSAAVVGSVSIQPSAAEGGVYRPTDVPRK
jgi:hypothetical protein